MFFLELSKLLFVRVCLAQLAPVLRFQLLLDLIEGGHELTGIGVELSEVLP